MPQTLVLRPFAQTNYNRLTWRDSPLYTTSSSSTNDIWGDSNGVEDSPTLSLSERLKARGWPISPVSTSSPPFRVPGLVNSGNLCFMNSVLQVSLHPTQLVLTIGTCLDPRIPRLFRHHQRWSRNHPPHLRKRRLTPPPQHPPLLLHSTPPRHHRPHPHAIR